MSLCEWEATMEGLAEERGGTRPEPATSADLKALTQEAAPSRSIRA